jgi:hypothetical protein
MTHLPPISETLPDQPPMVRHDNSERRAPVTLAAALVPLRAGCSACGTVQSSDHYPHALVAAGRRCVFFCFAAFFCFLVLRAISLRSTRFARSRPVL